ncbi:stress response translation initiation inhibitor YciH [Utexia brackfieldae]|uniref:stress response translation initiation inhibitor YciH n=1 Tax=Utexia brackfieldae TaxID=3074108 RepID=UPI00370D10C3
MPNKQESTLVYSTETGRIKADKPEVSRPKGDGIVRLRREVAGRKGKGVCVISGLDLSDVDLIKLAAELKKSCGCGGSVKAGLIEIQGDKRDLLKTLLEQKGFQVKLAGG